MNPLYVIACLGLIGGPEPEVAVSTEKPLPELHELWNFQDPAATEERFRELLPAAAASGELDYELQARTQLARTLGLQGRFDEAHAELDAVEGRLTEETRAARVRYLLERGRTLNSSKRPDESRPLFLEAWTRGREAGLDVLAVDAAHMLAIVAPAEAKLSWNEKAMALAESSAQPRAKGWLGSLYNNIGWDHHDQGEYEKALEVHRKGLRWHEERDRSRGAESPSRGARIAKWAVAKQLRMLGRTEEALQLQRELFDEWRQAGEESGFVWEEAAECLHALGRGEEAKAHFRKAHELLSQVSWVADDDPERLARLKRMAGD